MFCQKWQIWAFLQSGGHFFMAAPWTANWIQKCSLKMFINLWCSVKNQVRSNNHIETGVRFNAFQRMSWLYFFLSCHIFSSFLNILFEVHVFEQKTHHLIQITFRKVSKLYEKVNESYIQLVPNSYNFHSHTISETKSILSFWKTIKRNLIFLPQLQVFWSLTYSQSYIPSVLHFI